MTAIIRLVFAILILVGCGPARAQEHAHHHHSAADAKPVEPPTVFLDKSPRVVAYQLKRLDNERLLLVPRDATEAKYIPVYTAILTRAGMSPQFREEAVQALAALKESDAVVVLLEALSELESSDRQSVRTANELSGLLLNQPPQQLSQHADDLLAATDSELESLRRVGFAGLLVGGLAEQAARHAAQSDTLMVDFLNAIRLVPAEQARIEMRDQIVAQLAGQNVEVQKAAVRALASVPARQEETFAVVAPLVQQPQLRASAVSTALKIPADKRDPSVAADLLATLVQYAEQTPPEDRTSDAFVDAMQLADQSMVAVTPDAAKAFRQRLRAVTVRVVRIKTVEEEMRYDTPYFAVEAGRPVQVVLDNEDLMPHNLVLTVPGALKEVAQLGLAVGPAGGWQGKQYVPESDMVLQATPMVPAGAQQRLTFDAPAEPGEYPYVCTFPQHWQRMYGVMVVVEDLDAWLQDPIKPEDPIGSNRSFVQAWKVSDLQDALEEGLRGRSPEIGERIFAEASCANCHKMKGQGGAVGPELADVFKRWKGDSVAVLREILEPSHRIDPQYAMHVILTVDGRTLTGLVVAEDKDSVSLLENPEAKQPTVVPQDEIEEMVKTSKSMMPKALMDQYTQDEIFELLAYLRGEAN